MCKHDDTELDIWGIIGIMTVLTLSAAAYILLP